MRRSEIPWGIPDDWVKANKTISYLARIYRHKLRPVIKLAHDTRNRLETIFPILNNLCMNSCTMCPEPCCLSAKIWFNYQDLLFLHFTEQPIPDNQPLSSVKDQCRYISPKGCILPRLHRPWICTWYLCPPQMAVLRREIGKKEQVEQMILEIKEKRKAMENEFIYLTS